jgi:hypothetical protein
MRKNGRKDFVFPLPRFFTSSHSLLQLDSSTNQKLLTKKYPFFILVIVYSIPYTLYLIAIIFGVNKKMTHTLILTSVLQFSKQNFSVRSRDQSFSSIGFAGLISYGQYGSNAGVPVSAVRMSTRTNQTN